MSTASVATKKFHFGLNVADMNRAVAFYRILFGIEPTLSLSDYARFDVDDPPLVLALHPSPRSAGGALNHVGFRVANSEALVAVQRRLEEAGISTQREDGVECCYARQTKFWVPDADRNLWEVYTLEEDLDHSGFGGDGAGQPPVLKKPEASAIWEHMLITPLPERIPHADSSLDEVRLEGTFNLELSEATRAAFIDEILRVLRPGGSVAVHGLVASLPLPGRPNLPGPAALVQRIPLETETLDELRAAGFVGLSFERLGDIHCFRINGAELREMRLTALKPFANESTIEHSVLYRGPLPQVVDDKGRAFPRGVRVTVDGSTWNQFRRPPFAEHFVCFRC